MNTSPTDGRGSGARFPQLLKALRSVLAADEFRTWIRPLRLVSESDAEIVLEAPNDRFVGILEEGFRSLIDRVTESTLGSATRVRITASQLSLQPARTAIAGPGSGGQQASALVGDPGSDQQALFELDGGQSSERQPPRKAQPSRRAERLQPIEARRSGARAQQAAFTVSHQDGSLEAGSAAAAQTLIPRTETLGSTQGPTRSVGEPSSQGAPAEDRAVPDVLGGRPNIEPPRFNPKYRFNNFVVGDSNQFACAAARAVAESPGQSYNPLFLYGGVGLGKTHLLHAIGQEIQQQLPHLLVHYLSAEQFLNELINSIRFDRMPAFRERYRSIDVLLIDDIQFLANKERTQEEFFHTFNALYTSEKQIILSSDASPKDIPTLEERLRSRFEWGLITDIQPPDLETKIAILRRKAALRRCPLDDEVALFIAKQVRSNVRELEGLLNRVVAFASMSGRELDLDLAKETLSNILPQTDGRRTAAEILRTVAKWYGLKVSEIKSRNKSHKISFPRQVAMYLCKQLTDLSFPEIGKQFGDKHHSTVMHSVEKISKLREQDEELDRAIERLLLQLR